jgi:prevent-host-death family protein
MTRIRAELSAAIGRARYGNQPTFLTDRGKEVAVIVSVEMYEAMRKFLDDEF